jgi:hypothetical protein
LGETDDIDAVPAADKGVGVSAQPRIVIEKAIADY